MEHQTLRTSREEINGDLKAISPISHNHKSATLNGHYNQQHHHQLGANNNGIVGKLSNCGDVANHDFLHQFYYTMPPQNQQPPGSQLGVRLAPLAKFDERDFDLPPPSEAKQKVKLFRALLILFTTVILVSVCRFSVTNVCYLCSIMKCKHWKSSVRSKREKLVSVEYRILGHIHRIFGRIANLDGKFHEINESFNAATFKFAFHLTENFVKLNTIHIQ